MDNLSDELKKFYQSWETWNNKPVDYLISYPYLTSLGRACGLTDEQIRATNEAMVNDGEMLIKIYADDNL